MTKCTCTARQIQNYNSRISKPLLDRIDINVEVRKVEYRKLFAKRRGLGSAEMRSHVFVAQNAQKRRHKEEKIAFNSQLDTRLCEKSDPPLVLFARGDVDMLR